MFFFYLLIGLAIAAALFSGVRWYSTLQPRQVVTGLKVAAVFGGGLAAVWLLFTGQAIRILYFLLPFMPALKNWFRRARNAAGPAAGRTSDVETSWLRMSLDHDSGTVDGLVLQGVRRGRRLGELDAAALLDLLAELRVADGDSATLLEGYLDSVHPGWRDGSGGEGAGAATGAAAGGAMTTEEAYRVLGVRPDASEETIRAAYRELMKKVHPDQGGSAYLASKLNEAKALLLGE